MTRKSNHRSLLVLAMIAYCACAMSVHGQQTRLRPREIGQIADEVMLELVPPSRAVSGVAVKKRRIFFDSERTLTAFGYAAESTVIALRTDVQSGGAALLSDCRQIQKMPCSKLGWSVYIFLEPVSANDSEAVVWAHIRWPDRLEIFQPGKSPTGGAYLTGFSEEMHFRRSRDGTWKFEKEGKTFVL